MLKIKNKLVNTKEFKNQNRLQKYVEFKKKIRLKTKKIIPIMPTLKEKVFSRITEDFQVLAKIVIRQLNLTKQLMDDNHKEEIYTEINNNERIKYFYKWN